MNTNGGGLGKRLVSHNSLHYAGKAKAQAKGDYLRIHRQYLVGTVKAKHLALAYQEKAPLVGEIA